LFQSVGVTCLAT